MNLNPNSSEPLRPEETDQRPQSENAPVLEGVPVAKIVGDELAIGAKKLPEPIAAEIVEEVPGDPTVVKAVETDKPTQRSASQVVEVELKRVPADTLDLAAVPVGKLLKGRAADDEGQTTFETETGVSQTAPTQTAETSSTISQTSEPNRLDNPSWVFRVGSFVGRQVSNLLGIFSVIFLLAVTANIPIVQFLSFGYLLEVTGRLARRQPLSSAMIGLSKASKLGGIVLGTWLLLWPLRLISNFWFEAYLIDPASNQTMFWRIFQIVAIVLVVSHIGAAWLCGGKLRYFFWPIVAPFSVGVWLSRRFAGWKPFRVTLSALTGWFAPRLADDICNAPPITDWFLPAIFLKRLFRGDLYVSARDGVWDFVMELNLPYYFKFGFKGFVGTFLWLLIPTGLIVVSTFTEDGAAILSGLFGVLIAIPVFAVLLFLQAHYATDGKLSRFLEVRAVLKNFGRAPLAHTLALLVTLILALPLFFLKIETIPSELLWSLSIVFIVFTWPAKWIIGWAYGRGAAKEKPSRWFVRYPIWMFVLPISLSFVLILMFSRYISWNGAFSLFENHVFLLPAPFWQ